MIRFQLDQVLDFFKLEANLLKLVANLVNDEDLHHAFMVREWLGI